MHQDSEHSPCANATVHTILGLPLDLCMTARHRRDVTSAALVWCAEQDRLEVRRETNEQDKHLDVISDALTDLQRIGEVRIGDHGLTFPQQAVMYMQRSLQLIQYHTQGLSARSMYVQAMGSEVKYQDTIIERNQAHVSTADTQLKNLSNQAIKDHRLNYRRR